MNFHPSMIDENFGVGCTEEKLDHISVDIRPFDEAVRDIINISKLGFNRLNWIDANLPLFVTMRDKDDKEIPWECGEVVCRVHAGKVTLLIDDQIGNSARFELGQADGLWPELCESQEACHV